MPSLGRGQDFGPDGHYPSPTLDGPYGLTFRDTKFAAWAIATFEKLNYHLKKGAEAQDESEWEKALEEHEAIVRNTQTLYERWRNEGILGEDANSVFLMFQIAADSRYRSVRGFGGSNYWIELPVFGDDYNKNFKLLPDVAVLQKFIAMVHEDLAKVQKMADAPMPTEGTDFTKASIRLDRVRAKMSIPEYERLLKDLRDMVGGLSEPKRD